ncbi:hypothetical protein Prum_085860 [Phytohabitans rumicis]|uniref:Aminoglycoside phosphotransferase domain-containing protein n=1 Tax=Phytohabitans rumicis TaxID=1076125 RepID=A0A6V8LF76_9ACTN|nr:hypothetical protein Prum_085860 [Phytohabitans rumicis]
MGSGRNADVFALDEQRVLRRYREGGDVAHEAEVMAYVAGRGYPVPAVHRAEGPDLVLERLDGPTMLAAFDAGTLDLDAGARLLADLHTRLHAVPPRGADCVLHLDLHPDNVILSARGPVVIDWRNATDGPADLDVALSALILAQVATTPGQWSEPARALLPPFLRYAGGQPTRMLDRAVAMRAADPNQTAPEAAALTTAATLIRTHTPNSPSSPRRPAHSSRRSRAYGRALISDPRPFALDRRGIP